MICGGSGRSQTAGAILALMADVRPFRALRYAPGTDLGAAICPPFDVISPDEQRELYARSHLNAVHIELADESLGDRYDQAMNTLSGWLDERALRRDEAESFYVYRQTFERDGKTFSRTIVFARVRLEPWEAGSVLPHEQTFGGPKEDRLKLLRAIHLNTSPIYMLYRDARSRVEGVVREVMAAAPSADFQSPDGQSHTLWAVEAPGVVAELHAMFGREPLFIADGHHRYETALAYRDEVREKASSWTGEEPENFVMAALTAANDPGLVVLPIHRVTNVATDSVDAMKRVREIFDIEEVPLTAKGEAFLDRAAGSRGVTAIASKDSPDSLMVLTVRNQEELERRMPQDRSEAWRALDYSIANHAMLQYCLGLSPHEMRDYSRVWFTEDAAEATTQVRSGAATYAVLMRPVSVERVLELAEAGERMPQKSTFFYPKVPTGIVFNPLMD
jgi:uncharacterized protein (DUF1015 family)